MGISLPIQLSTLSICIGSGMSRGLCWAQVGKQNSATEAAEAPLSPCTQDSELNSRILLRKNDPILEDC